jgi:hypothetical protein
MEEEELQSNIQFLEIKNDELERLVGRYKKTVNLLEQIGILKSSAFYNLFMREVETIEEREEGEVRE